MSETIKKVILDIANKYHENAEKKKSPLTEKDFLADMALEKGMAGCNGTSATDDRPTDMRCVFFERDLYRKSEDSYIDSVLGISGSAQRSRYEAQAKALLRVAQKYKDSSDLDRPDHPYRLEIKVLETNFQHPENTQNGAGHHGPSFGDELNRQYPDPRMR